MLSYREYHAAISFQLVVNLELSAGNDQADLVAGLTQFPSMQMGYGSRK